MLEKLAEQALINLGTAIAGEIANNPQGVLNGLEELANSLCPHHTALDVAQDALDAVEGGDLSPEAAMQVVAVILQDRKRNAAPAPSTNRPTSSATSDLDRIRRHPNFAKDGALNNPAQTTAQWLESLI